MVLKWRIKGFLGHVKSAKSVRHLSEDVELAVGFKTLEFLLKVLIIRIALCIFSTAQLL